jgi:hypothetical protein
MLFMSYRGLLASVFECQYAGSWAYLFSQCLSQAICADFRVTQLRVSPMQLLSLALLPSGSIRAVEALATPLGLTWTKISRVNTYTLKPAYLGVAQNWLSDVVLSYESCETWLNIGLGCMKPRCIRNLLWRMTDTNRRRFARM